MHSLYLVILSVYAYGNFVCELLPSLLPVMSGIRAILDILLLGFGIKYVFRKENIFLKRVLTLFVIISSITFYLNSESLTYISHLNGLREPLVLMVSLSILTSTLYSEDRKEFVRKINKFLLVFLIIQVPVAISQYVRFGAGDLVGGTFSDGGSGMLSQVIFLSVYYFAVTYSGKPNSVGFYAFKTLPFLILLIPVFINETKISFVLLVIAIVLQIRVQLNVFKIMLSIIGGLIVLLIFVKVLESTTDTNLVELLDPDTIERFYVSDWSDAEDITRFGKLFLAMNDFGDDTKKHAFGAGYGIMKGKIVTESSAAGREYEKLYFGSRMMIFSSYIQGGVLFTALFLLLNFYYFFRSKNAFYHHNFFRYRLFVMFIFILMWIYNDALLVTYFNLFAVYFLTFIKHGDPAFLVKSHVLDKKNKPH